MNERLLRLQAGRPILLKARGFWEEGHFSLERKISKTCSREGRKKDGFLGRRGYVEKGDWEQVCFKVLSPTE